MQEYIEEINTCEIGLQLLEKIRNIHKDQRLCGEPGNVLLDAHDDLLLYILALLRGDAHFLPEFHPPGEIRDQMRTAFLMSCIGIYMYFLEIRVNLILKICSGEAYSLMLLPCRLRY